MNSCTTINLSQRPPGSADPGADCLGELRMKLAGGMKPTPADVLRATIGFFASNPVTLVPVLGMLSLQGKPFSLRDYCPFEPIYKLRVPKRQLWKSARQVAKTTNLAGNIILRSGTNPYLRILAVAPRFEQIRRLSANYVRPFIRESLIAPLLVDESCTQAVLQRTYANGSTNHFSFAFLDCDRIRGIACEMIMYDEIQDLDPDFMSIIHECTSASKLGIGVEMYAGTPKTLDNGIEKLWEDSSKAEWVTPCSACGHWNTANVHEDLFKMIGPIGKGVICSRCQNRINPGDGHWHHTDASHLDFPGYHIPQVILPLHYDNRERWGELIGKRDGQFNYNKAKFLNEVLGESSDEGTKLVSVTDIRKASQLGPNDFRTAVEHLRQCKVRVLGVDWGGGGESGISFTKLALVGLNPITGQCQCHYAEQFHAGHSHMEEARKLLTYFREADCHFFAHDYGGSGSARETIMIQAGGEDFLSRIWGFSYVRATTQNMCHRKPPAPGEMRGYWALDKSRSLQLQANCLKMGAVQLPEYESSKHVTHDLLALMEDKHDTPHGADIFLIRRHPKLSDDFAHALNYACMAIWHSEGAYPDMASLSAMQLTPEQLQFAAPPGPEWDTGVHLHSNG
jgi:hypothetical protein